MKKTILLDTAMALAMSEPFARELPFTTPAQGQKQQAQGDDLRAKFKALSQQENDQIKGVITADQYAKIQAAKQQRQGAPRGQ